MEIQHDSPGQKRLEHKSSTTKSISSDTDRVKREMYFGKIIIAYVMLVPSLREKQTAAEVKEEEEGDIVPLQKESVQQQCNGYRHWNPKAQHTQDCRRRQFTESFRQGQNQLVRKPGNKSKKGQAKISNR
ncbi:hypothetical protein EYF80_017683 [Liparis tanakae]|uniref:Uncharacterized protein n=1 Tax=Liparis tanakae TaxID=230148 RepID=A0A4Z2I201_9TELE|nr:hypothetical protein EYF80_017683 [Liparis tanakae]